MLQLNYLLPISILIFTPILASNLEHDGSVTIKLEHALLGPEIFTERGNITIQSLRLGQAIINQNPLTADEQLKLRDLAAQNGFYKIRSTVLANDGSKNTFISTAKACMLAEAELDDRLSVSLDYSGRVIGVTLVIASSSTCEGATVPLPKLKQFTTNVYVRHTETGPIPDTAAFIQRQEREKEAKERGEVKDNRSFFAKYWMYIVPVVVVMVISSATNPDGGAAPAR